MDYDFGGWATKNNLKCTDGRTIRRGAFKECDKKKVPLVWNHNHAEPDMVLGHAILEDREEGVYCYCSFNDTTQGQIAKTLVQHGDIGSLSIYANQLKQIGRDVVHGNIREVSLVHAGANPAAFIDTVIQHSDDSDEEAIVYTGEELELAHSDKGEKKKEEKIVKESEKKDDVKDIEDIHDKEKTDEEKTIGEIFNTLTEEQKTVVYALIGQALEEKDEDEKKEEEKSMKHNVFDTDTKHNENVLSHSDMENIIDLAKSSSIGSFQEALNLYAEENMDTLSHGIDDIESLFPEYKDVKPGAPEFISRDQGWVGVVMDKTHKSPISRIRTRQADIRNKNLRAYGYKKGDRKQNQPNFRLLKRTTDPQTIYIKDYLNRDDIVDITDFDVVAYLHQQMRQNLKEEIALAVMIGDGRDEGDDMKIAEDHIRPIWKDDDLYTIHTDVDIAAAKAELQGTDTSANFGDNYVYAEAIITAALYSREKYKGSGTPDFYCTPHLLNVMLLARDLNGRRIYNSKSDLAAALNVGEIYTAEQFEGKTRTTSDNATKKLLGLFVNLDDYQIGSTKGGEISSFNQFDIDFNQEKYLIETRLSGALTRVYSAIALEEPVTSDGAEG